MNSSRRSVDRRLYYQTQGFQMIKVRLYDNKLYDVKDGDNLITLRKTGHGDIKEACKLPHTYPDLVSGTKVIVRGITMDFSGRAWLKCEAPSGVVYQLNSTHLDLV
jgi:hypothetical protein